MLKNSLFSPLCSAPFFCFNLFLSFLLQRRTSLPFFCFCFSSSLSFSTPFLFFWLPFIFQPKILFFQPKRFSVFSAQTFFSPNVFALLSSASFFSYFFSPYIFKGQPKTCCSPKISLQPKRVALLS